jgi:4-diphosphocytidyl-2-C-methyl-D-erythritol kinase
MTLEKPCPCKVNLLLNVLGRRPDGFHGLETVMHPVNVCDTLTFTRVGEGLKLSCGDVSLPTDAGNLVYRAASAFFTATQITAGMRIHLEKRIPQAAGLGGGSGNAATTLLGLNELFGQPLSREKLNELAATLGSDIPFFLQGNPAVATGRGEKVQPLDFFPALRGTWLLLVHPGFGISTPWAYQNLARFPEALNGKPGRAATLISLLRTGNLAAAAKEFYNSLEAPALEKYPVLALYQDFLCEQGAVTALMSGSGSTTFAIFRERPAGEAAVEKFRSKFGSTAWTAIVPV